MINLLKFIQNKRAIVYNIKDKESNKESNINSENPDNKNNKLLVNNDKQNEKELEKSKNIKKINDNIPNDQQQNDDVNWHNILGHPGQKFTSSFHKKGIKCIECLTCMQTNIKHHSAYKGSPDKYKVEIPFHKIHTDLCIVSNGKGKPYGKTTTNLLVMIDDFTDFKYIDFPNKKNETGDRIERFIKIVENFYEQRIKYFATDKGKEFIGGKSLETLQQHGIRLTTTSGYSSKSNGKVEKLNQDILRRVRPMLLASGLTLDFWEYAAMHAIEIMNRRPLKKLEDVSPLEYVMGEINSTQEIVEVPPYEFGALVVVKIKSQGKLGNRGIPAAYLGISRSVAGGFTTWIPTKMDEIHKNEFIKECGRIYDTKDVQFMNSNTKFMDWFKSKHDYDFYTNYDDLTIEINNDEDDDEFADLESDGDIIQNELNQEESKMENKIANTTTNSTNPIIIHNHIHQHVPDVDIKNKNVIPSQYQEAYKFEVSPLKAIGGDISNSTLNHSDHFDNSYNNIINNDFLSEIQNLSNNNITNDSSHLGGDNNNTNSGGDNNTNSSGGDITNLGGDNNSIRNDINHNNNDNNISNNDNNIINSSGGDKTNKIIAQEMEETIQKLKTELYDIKIKLNENENIRNNEGIDKLKKELYSLQEQHQKKFKEFQDGNDKYNEKLFQKLMVEKNRMVNDFKKDTDKIRDSINEFGNTFVSEKNKLENKIYNDFNFELKQNKLDQLNLMNQINDQKYAQKILGEALERQLNTYNQDLNEKLREYTDQLKIDNEEVTKIIESKKDTIIKLLDEKIKNETESIFQSLNKFENSLVKEKGDLLNKIYSEANDEMDKYNVELRNDMHNHMQFIIDVLTANSKADDNNLKSNIINELNDHLKIYHNSIEDEINEQLLKFIENFGENNLNIKNYIDENNQKVESFINAQNQDIYQKFDRYDELCEIIEDYLTHLNKKRALPEPPNDQIQEIIQLQIEQSADGTLEDQISNSRSNSDQRLIGFNGVNHPNQNGDPNQNPELNPTNEFNPTTELNPNDELNPTNELNTIDELNPIDELNTNSELNHTNELNQNDKLIQSNGVNQPNQEINLNQTSDLNQSQNISMESNINSEDSQYIGSNTQPISSRLRRGYKIKSDYRKGSAGYSKKDKNSKNVISRKKLNYLPVRILHISQKVFTVKINSTNKLLIPDVRLKDYEIENHIHIFNISVKAAMNSNEKQKWKDAMKKEYENLLSHSTWDLKVTELTSYEEKRKIVKTMWVLNNKRDGSYKARLVARGDTQPDDTFDETYASTLSYESLRLILAESCLMNYHIELMDISNAYVNADIDTEIYIQLPENTPFLNVKNYDGHKSYGHKLLKSLYGLKQSGRNWQLLLEQSLISYGFEKWSDVECIMRKRDSSGKVLVMIGYFVDDLIIAGNKSDVIDTMNQIKNNFKCTVTEFDEAGYKNILGIDIKFLDGKIQLNQTKYIQKLGNDYNYAGKDYVTPIREGFYFNPFDKEITTGLSKLNERIKWMRKMIGALLFIAGATRPDIQYAVNYLARYVLTPTDEIIEQTGRILKYLIATAELMLEYSNEYDIQLIGYSDADHSGDKSDFISMKGSIFMYGNGPISWKSKKGRVSQSSTDSEIFSVIQTCNMSVKLRRLIKFIHGYESEDADADPTIIYCDNNSALRMANTGAVTQTTNYLTQDAYVVNQFVKNKVVSCQKINTVENIADILTKPVKGPTMKYLRSKLLH